MKNQGIRKAHLFFYSFFICLLHIPFVFAKTKPKLNGLNTAGTVAPVTMAGNALPPQLMLDNNAVNNLYDSLRLSSMGLARQVFEYAMKGFQQLSATGKLANTSVISIIDFTKSSAKKRLYIIDLKNYKVLFNTYVAHGMNSGQEFARQFSNIPESNKSSLGFYQTADTYVGKHGYSLRLRGVEKGINDNVHKRDIVLHAADYVSESTINAKGYIGRSHGCPAVPERLHKPIIEKIKNGSCLFIFGEDRNYIRRSAMLKNTHSLLG
jgi:hypothetical protein